MLAHEGTPTNDPLFSHSYIVTTTPDNKVKDTYSWGVNKTKGEDIVSWGDPNYETDRNAANKALKNPMIQWEKLGDDDLDPYVDQAYEQMRQPGSDSNHKWDKFNNCKDEAYYELLVLVDAIRGGKAREREMAIAELRKRLGGEW